MIGFAGRKRGAPPVSPGSHPKRIRLDSNMASNLSDITQVANPLRVKLSRPSRKTRRKRQQERQARAALPANTETQSVPSLEPLAETGEAGIIPPPAPATTSTPPTAPIPDNLKPPEKDPGMSIVNGAADALEQHCVAGSDTQSFRSQVAAGLTCEICADIYNKPYANVPCGHVACYQCLLTWFQTRSESVSAEEVTNTQAALLLRRKTCPVCRTVLQRRPIMIFTIKTLCELVATSSRDYDVPHTGAVTPSATIPDPWGSVFPPDYEIYASNDRPMVDHEDGNILRCPDCGHEIWGSTCTGCGRLFRDLQSTAGIDNFQTLVSGVVDSDASSGNTETELHSLDGSEDSESYEGSFIDDAPLENDGKFESSSVDSEGSKSEDDDIAVPSSRTNSPHDDLQGSTGSLTQRNILQRLRRRTVLSSDSEQG